uniref:Uncharacterized protein n=1 Tax=Anguilla anguilla TaxID=7936 RepID=A0A0E9QCH2_ANGAN
MKKAIHRSQPKILGEGVELTCRKRTMDEDEAYNSNQTEIVLRVQR